MQLLHLVYPSESIKFEIDLIPQVLHPGLPLREHEHNK